MFPGQNSRTPDMLEKLISQSAVVRAMLAESSEILGRDLAKHYSASNPDIFSSNRHVQIGMFLANHAHLLLLREAGIEAEFSLGLSLGEYNHLVHIEAIGFSDALRLIEHRGRLFEDGPEGAMVSVFPSDSEDIERMIADLGVESALAIGLYTSPRQQVLSGRRDALKPVIACIEENTLAQTVEIEPRIPMHSPIFRPVAEQFRVELEAVHFSKPDRPYVSNVQGGIVEAVDAQCFRTLLANHVCRPVRWWKCVNDVATQCAKPLFLEVGPRSILYNLFGRGWNPGARAKTDSPQDFSGHFRSVIDTIRNGF